MHAYGAWADWRLSWHALVYHGIPWYMYTMVCHGLPWYTMASMAYHGMPWHTMVDHGMPWYTMVHHGDDLMLPEMNSTPYKIRPSLARIGVVAVGSVGVVWACEFDTYAHAYIRRCMHVSKCIHTCMHACMHARMHARRQARLGACHGTWILGHCVWRDGSGPSAMYWAHCQVPV